VIVIARGSTVTQGTPQQLCDLAGLDSLEDAFVKLVGTEEGIEL
jgi:sodium transport system ATP-binding protein